MSKTLPLILAALLALLTPFISCVAEEVAKPAAKTLVWPDGTRYVGGVEDGKRTGRGTIFWQDGTRFVGQFVNDMRNGPGTMILPDGTVYTGFFKDDELVESPAESNIIASKNDIEPLTVQSSNPETKLIDDEISRTIIAFQPTTAAEISPAVDDVVKPKAVITAQKTITKLTDDVQQQLKETIDLWAAAWSDKNVPQYLSNYSKDFAVPGKLSRKSWEGLRRTRLHRPKYIRITIDYDRFEIVEPDTADVYFKQTYRSNTYSDITNKILHLRKEDHTWMILSERSRPG